MEAYEAPKMEIIEFEVEDIITGSGTGSDSTGSEGGWTPPVL